MTPAPRLAKLTSAELTDEQRELHRAIAGGIRAHGPVRITDDAGALEGPFNAMLLAPRLGFALQGLGSAIRYGAGLPDRDREIAILVVAAHWHSAFEQYAHEAVARDAGLRETELAALRELRTVDLGDPRERLVADTTYALVTRSDLTDDEYAAAVATIGSALLFELLTLVGYYATLALQLRVFRVGAPA